jgi:hypothetical protein
LINTRRPKAGANKKVNHAHSRPKAGANKKVNQASWPAEGRRK